MEKCYLILDIVAYLSMLGLGFYLINHGDVIQRYYRKRTNFAVHEEPIRELPVLVTWIKHAQNLTVLKYERDYKIQFQHGTHQVGINAAATNLTYGENQVENSSLKLNVTEMTPGSLGIAFEDFSSNIHQDYHFTYLFENPRSMEDHRIVAQIVTANGSFPCNGKFNDGNGRGVYLKLGKVEGLLIKAKKVVRIQELSDCRRRPYIEEFNEKFLSNIQQKCSRPCKHPKAEFMCNSFFISRDIQQLPICKGSKDLECFDDVFANTLTKINEQPCTLLTFGATRSVKYINDTEKAVLKMIFDPPKVEVQEEYLIYDLVSMISAIGGTMGLCVGFSFTHFMGVLISLIKQTTKKFKGHAENHDNRLFLKTKYVQTINDEYQKDPATSVIKLQEDVAKHVQLMTKMQNLIANQESRLSLVEKINDSHRIILKPE